ncbi:LysR family transcriptional regulator [Methylosoma difficile]|jgi:Transcriptional regulator
MEMHQIRYFLAVCDHGSFTRAAQFSYVSQPSLTQAIKKLEEELGGELFTRERTGCLLTSLGRIVEPNFRRIYKEAAATKADAIRFTRLNNIPLRIGLMTTIGAQRLSPIFGHYQQEFPNIELELIVDNESALLQQLETDILDLVISAPLHLLGSPYESTMLYTEKYKVVFNNKHRFNHFSQIELKDIQSEPYLDRLNCELREGLRALCQNQEVNLYAAYRSNSEDWIVNLVRAGLGVALMPEYSLPANTDDVRYRYLSNPEISRKIYAIHFPQSQKKSEVKNLLTLLIHN